MDMETNLRTLKDMILDERKLVTYISLSKELCIHVNEGKSLLSQVVEDIRKNQPKSNIYVTYIISGLSNNNKASTTVCPESDIDSIKKTFKMIFYEHIYGVSHGLASVDNVAFTLVNKFEDFPLCTGLIKGNICVKRTSDEIGNLKTNSQSKITEAKSSTVGTQKTVKEKTKEVNKTGNEDVKKLFGSNSEPHVKVEITSPKKDSQKTSPKNDNHKTSPKKPNSKAPVTKNGKANSIAGFLKKTPSAPSLKSTTKKDTEKKNLIETKSEKDIKIEVEHDIKVKDEPMDTEKDVIPETVKISKTSENKSQNKTTKKNSLKEIKKNAKIDKKRKRVLLVSDSESDNEVNDPFKDEKMVEDEDSEDEIPPTPTVSTVKITSGMVNPKKRRKIVDKTYTDEDGFLLTKKVEVYESCSENEEEQHSKQNIEELKENVEIKANNQKVTQIKSEVSPKSKGKGGKKKVSPPKSGKQATMLNFFTKKT